RILIEISHAYGSRSADDLTTPLYRAGISLQRQHTRTRDAGSRRRCNDLERIVLIELSKSYLLKSCLERRAPDCRLLGRSRYAQGAHPGRTGHDYFGFRVADDISSCCGDEKAGRVVHPLDIQLIARFWRRSEIER